MKRHTFTIGAVIAVFALSQAPAFGQAGSRPNTTGSSSGSAAPRGGDPGGSSSGSSAGSSSSGSGSSSGAVSRPSGGGFGSSSGVSSRERAPERPYAVPRSGSSATGGSMASRPEGASRLRGAEAAAHAVPAYSRPNPGRNSVGSAIDRRDAPAPPPGSNIIFYPYNPYYYNDWRYGSRYGYGYGFGFSHFGWYDPLWMVPAYYGSPSYSAGGYSSQKQYGTGNLRLRVEPKHAEVYVDGYFVGTVDEFDGLFQRLNIDAGPHKIELRADGYEPVEFEVLVTPGETVTYRGGMKPRMP